MARLAFVAFALASASASDAQQSGLDPALSPARVFAQRDGRALYGAVCAGCHMPDGKGAVGAAAYPALARNPKLEQAGYPASVVVLGLRGMPPFGAMMTNEQVAEVVNYVRTHFGNSYGDPVAAVDIAPLRR